MIEYTYQHDENEERLCCDNCEYPAKLHLFRNSLLSDGKWVDLWLCEVCSMTYLSNAKKYPGQCPDADLYRSIAILANMIIERIDELAKTIKEASET